MRHKRRKKHVYAMLICALFFVALILIFTKGKRIEKQAYREDCVWNYEVAPLMQFTYYTQDEWEKKLKLNGKLTTDDVTYLLEQIHLDEYITIEEKSEPLSRKEWSGIYEQILDYLDDRQEVTKENLLVLKKKKDAVVTGEGTYQTDVPLQWMEKMHCYEVYRWQGKIIGIAGKDTEAVTLKNEYITSCEEGRLTFLCDNESYTVSVDTEESFVNVVADLVFEDERIQKITKKEDSIRGTLMARDDETMEVKGYGKIACDSQMKFYATYDGVRQVEQSSLLLENMDMTFLVADGKICAVLLEQPSEYKYVRVLLLQEEQMYRSEVSIVSDGPMRLIHNESEQVLESGSIVNASALTDMLAESSVTVAPAEEGNLLYLSDTQGNRISLGYHGTMELRRYEQGYTVVNVVGLEDYIAGVVPSEMPSGFSLQALMAQAVCARSYACRQLMDTKYSAYAAHVDDSVNYQVYNKKESTDIVRQAVAETTGKVLTCQGEVIETFYFSTSFGHTGNFEAWNLSQEEYPYLCGGWVRFEDAGVNLSEEAAFAEYIKNPDPECYESEVKFFRWKAQLNFAEKEDSMKAVIEERKSIQQDAIRYYTKDRSTEAESLWTMGELENITVSARNECGNIKELVLTFADGVVTVTSEYNMRAILGCGLTELLWQDGSNGEMSILPSAYFCVEKQEDGSYSVYGGGYGHGLGMSQNGAEKLALAGYDFQEILTCFYPGTELTVLY